eukprot:TRINITY_DN12517_c1_g3_i2.p2 TRINITY_DN12517_c1_g3~~TRINITY_DN12517_c1_g3_i2.p2  ORF type:complete len:504 (+),score=117.95 TRINITY_DN12517_c1_g3_i2:1805-3316(+)
MDDFAEPFDVIVSGTGLVGSILAAAYARVGKRVLHVDEKGAYGGLWSTVSVDELPTFAESDLTEFEEWRAEGFEGRRVMIDITPKVCASRGSLVKLLLSSNTSRYLEFKPVSNLLSHSDDKMARVPFSKASLMRDKTLSPKDKRVLVRYLQSCKADAELDALSTVSFRDHLKTKHGLSEALMDVLLDQLLWLDEDVDAAKGTACMQTFLASLEVYSPTPYIAIMYGVGEVAQAFCRLCAVFGGIYMLRSNSLDLPSTSVSETDTISLDLGHATVTTSKVLVGSTHSNSKMARLAAVLTNTPSQFPGENPNSLLSVRVADAWVRAILQPADLGIAQGQQCVLQLWTKHTDDDWRRVLEQALSALLGEAEEALLVYKCSYLMPCFDQKDLIDNVFQDLPDVDATVDDAVSRAQQLFQHLEPDLEFLPAAPNPEDLVFDVDPPSVTPLTTSFGTMYLPVDAYPTDPAIPPSPVAIDDVRMLIATNLSGLVMKHALAQCAFLASSNA